MRYNYYILNPMIYQPFGMVMPGRQYNNGSHKYGYNGLEKDDEIAGDGNFLTAEYWEYDSRAGRRWNRDPITKPWESPYASFSDNPIYFSDPSGLDSKDPKEAKSGAKDGAGTVYSDNDNRRTNGNTHEVFNNQCNCYVNDELLDPSDNATAENPSGITPSTGNANAQDASTIPTGNASPERVALHVPFTVASISAGGGAFGVGFEGAIKEFHIEQTSAVQNFLYPSDKPIYIWEADGKGGVHGGGVSANFGDGYFFQPDPWEPIDEQLNNFDDYDLGAQYGIISITTTKEVSLNPSRLQYTMMGIGAGANVKFESPISIGAGSNGLITDSIRKKSRPRNRADSMKTALAYPYTEKGKAFLSGLNKK